MDENYFRPLQEQLNKIVPKIESETITDINSDNYVSDELVDPRIDALEKRISELEQENKNIKHSLSELENDIKEIQTAFKNIYNTLQDYIKQH